jgi:ABC-type transporter Mla subunit MlaD
MNKERRKQLAAVMDSLGPLRERLAALISDLEPIRDELESIRDDEQDAFDNSPESVQEGDRGQTMEEAISNIESAVDAVSELIDSLGYFDVDSVLGNIDDARGQ